MGMLAEYYKLDIEVLANISPAIPCYSLFMEINSVKYSKVFLGVCVCFFLSGVFPDNSRG